MINQKFKIACPTCKEKDKVVSKCKECFIVCCSSCSFEMVCIDCFVKAFVRSKLPQYAEEERLVHIIAE